MDNKYQNKLQYMELWIMRLWVMGVYQCNREEPLDDIKHSIYSHEHIHKQHTLHHSTW